MLGDSWVDLGRPHVGSEDVLCIKSLGGGIVLAGPGCLSGNAGHWFRSTDYGLTWVDKGEMPSNTNEENVNVLVDCGDGIVMAGLGPGLPQVSRSANYGDAFAWIKMLGDFQDTALSGAYLGLSGGNHIIVMGTGTNWTTAPRIYRSADRGLTFDAGQMISGLLDYITNLLSLGSGIAIYSSKDGEIGRTVDYGVTWSQDIHDFGGYTKRAMNLLNIDGVIYALLADGDVMKSVDQGSNWTKVGETGTTTAQGFAYVPETGLMFAGVGGIGYTGHIYRSQDLGATWTDLGVVSSEGGIRTIEYIVGSSEYILLAGDGGTVLADIAHIYRASEAIIPVADFSAEPREGKYPLTVHFTDLSLNAPISWLWNFGHEGTSEEQNPTHIYKEAGLYTISLTATNEAGSDTETKFDYIEAIEGSFIEKRGIEERQLMKIRHISLKRGLAITERIPIRVLEPMRDPPPKRLWR